MELERKKRLLAAALASLACWPPVHIALSRAYGIYPWKLFGWGMYAVPRERVALAADDPGRGGRPIDLRTAVPAPERQAYLDRRWVLGRLAPPDRIARRIFERHPGLRRLRLQVRRLVLSLRTSRYETQRFDYFYERPADASAAEP